MKFGISTLILAQSIRPAKLGVALEERGFELLLLGEHSHIPVKRESVYPPTGRLELPPPYYHVMDPFVGLASAATVTEKLLLGTGIALLIQRDTIQAAKEVASLDVLSGGRVLFGVSAGWNLEEMRNHGTDPRTRGARLNEQLDAITEIWTKDEPEFHGEFVDFDPIIAWPKPVQRPRPPIFVGGQAPGALARVAAHADGWMPTAQPEPELVRAQFQDAAEAIGRNPRIIATTAPPDPKVVEAYLAGGAEALTFPLPPIAESEVLRQLDKLAALIDGFR